MTKLFVIACESSGDYLASKVVRSMLVTDPNLKIYGLGGDNLKRCGLSSIFDITPLSIMGFVSVVKNYRLLKSLIKQTIDEITKVQPDIVLTVDSGGFCFRVIGGVKKRCVKKHERNNTSLQSIKFYHYVSPAVWAYKEKRAAKLKSLYDRVFCILPFEPQLLAKYDMPATFVGMQYVFDNILQWGIVQKDKDMTYNLNLELNTQHKKSLILAITLGSRMSEIKNHAKVIKSFLKKFFHEHPQLATQIKPVFMVNEQDTSLVRKFFPQWEIVSDGLAKKKLIFDCDLCLLKSGTNTIEFLSAHGDAITPCVVYFKLGFINLLLIRSFFKQRYINIVNIIANKELIPECCDYASTLNYKCLSSAVLQMLNNDRTQPLNAASHEILSIIKSLALIKSPSDIVANTILATKPTTALL